MATAAKSATTKPGATEEAAVPPAKKSKKMLFIIITVVLLLIGGGAAAYFWMKPAHPPTKNAAKDEATDEATDAAAEATPEATPEEKATPPKYVPLGTFTANLIHEEGDRYLQVAISIKISKPELEEKIKATNPEILHHVNMLLQSKRPSELATLEGKEKLASDIKTQIERILGLIKVAPVNSPAQSASAPAVTQPHQNNGIEEVLFTSFIIQ
jgi:flagellar protein FliL